MFSFNELLILFSGILFLVVVFSFINEKTLKLPYEIGLVIFGFLFCVVLIIFQAMNVTIISEEMLALVSKFNFNDFLINGVLCFMLFSGAASIKFNDFNQDKFLIGSMAIFGTIISTIVYGVLFWGFATIIHINISFLEALILGAIVAPTDPISAMSILGKVGLPKRLALIVEGESLFNDGVAVAIFATLMTVLVQSTEQITLTEFIWGLMADVLGAVLVGLVVSILLFQIFKYSQNRNIKIFTSILTVMLAYILCENFGFSGPIAAVICGLSYASGFARLEKKGIDAVTTEIHDLFYAFWGVIDNLLNGILFLLVGLIFVDIKNLHDFTPMVIIGIVIGAIIINTISRIIGVTGTVAFTKKLPFDMKKSNFTIFSTWTGLKGGLCLALVMGTITSLNSTTYSLFLIATYAIVLFTTLFQGLTVGKAYLKLK